MPTRFPGPPAAAPDLSIFDYDALCDRLNGRCELVEQLVRMVLSEYQDQRERIAMRVGLEDATGLIEAAHRLKGQLLTVGVDAAADVARRIEEYGRAGRPGGATPLLSELDAQMRRFEALVNDQFAGKDG
jgi:HPt (histidine-containing phosphotransfer) domain-containing protein